MLQLCLAGWLGAGTAFQESADPVVRNPALRQELLKRAEQDQTIRNELISKGVAQPDPSAMSRMQAIDASNTEWMRSIIRQHGWPGPELVGKDGTEAAFLLVQHADLPLQKEVLPRVEQAFRIGSLPAHSYTLLIDRVRVREGRALLSLPEDQLVVPALIGARRVDLRPYLESLIETPYRGGLYEAYRVSRALGR